MAEPTVVDRALKALDPVDAAVLRSSEHLAEARAILGDVPPPAQTVARDDAARTIMGVPVNIDALGNDEVAGAIVTGFTQPLNGTVEQLADGRFRYAPLPGYLGKDRFAYTLLNALTDLTAIGEVEVTVDPPVIEPPTDPDPPPAGNLPMTLPGRAKRVLDCGSTGDIASAQREAGEGDHIVLRDNMQPGVLRVERKGVLIRPQSLGGITLTSAPVFHSASKDNTLDGFAMVGLGSITLQGDRNGLLRCDLSKYCQTQVRLGVGDRMFVAWSLIREAQPWTADEIATAKRGEYPLKFGIRYNDDFPRNFLAWGVGFFDTTIEKPIKGVYHSGQADAAELGEGGNLAGRMTYPRMIWCLVDRWYASGGTGAGIIDIKTGGAYLEDVTLYDAPRSRIDNRGGDKATFRRIWVERAEGMAIHGRGHLLEAIRTDPGSYGLNLMSGDLDDGRYEPAGKHNRARDAVLRAIQGPVKLGSSYRPYKATGITLEGDFPVSEVYCDRPTRRPLGDRVIRPPRRIQRHEVGPRAVASGAPNWWDRS